MKNMKNYKQFENNVGKLTNQWYFYFSNELDTNTISITDSPNDTYYLTDEYDEELYKAMKDITGNHEEMEGIWEYDIDKDTIREKMKEYGIIENIPN